MVELGGHLATNAGVAISGAAVAVFATSVNATQATSTDSAVACGTTVTSSGGDWSFSCLPANTYDVRITCGSSVRWRRYVEEVQITTGTLANLDVDGTVDADVTDFDVLSSGDIDLVSSANTAAAIYIAQSTGTSGTIKIHADTGTSVTEGAESVNILSDVGGIGLRSTANLANAINLTVDGGTTSSMTLFNDQGTGNTEGSASIQLLSDAGGINIKSTADLAGSVRLTADGGTSETIILHADQGTSVTEGAESISLLSDAGGVGIRSTANLANAVNITADGGTTSTIQIFNDQGTAVNEGVASIQILSDVGGIGVKSGLNAAGAIRLTADAGTSETIILHADQGSGTDSIHLLSDAGGITLNPGTFVTIGGIADGEIRLFEDTGAGCNYAAIKVQNMSASYTLTLPADDGCCGEALTTNGSGLLTWAATAGGPCQASQAEIDGGCNVDKYAPPDLLTKAVWSVKFWAQVNQTGTQALGSPDHNIASICDTGTGRTKFVFTTAMSDADYGMAGFTNCHIVMAAGCAGTTTTMEVGVKNLTCAHALADSSSLRVIGVGDQ
jgi:fibronectin-binding autotransporter adhesin